MRQTRLSALLSKLRLKLSETHEKKRVLAEFFYDACDYEKSYKAYDDLYKETKDEEYLIQILWMTYQGLGVEKDTEYATKKLEGMESSRAYYEAGKMKYWLGDYSGAEELFNKSISVGDNRSYYSLGVVLEASGRLQDAFESYLKGSSKNMLACKMRLLSKDFDHLTGKRIFMNRALSILKIRMSASYILGFESDISAVSDLYPYKTVCKREIKRLPRHP